MSSTESKGKETKVPVVLRVLLMLGCLFGMGMTCTTVLSNKGVRGYTFEEALRLVQQEHTNKRAACAELRDRIEEAIAILRTAGPDGELAVEAIHERSR